jgi:hypothetical protein
MNYRRGLKRAYLVVTAVWIACWLVALPLQKMRGDARLRAALVKACSERPDEPSRQRRFDEEERASRAEGPAGFFFRAHVLGPYSLLPFLMPAVVYPLLLAAIRAVSWVQRGFRET